VLAARRRRNLAVLSHRRKATVEMLGLFVSAGIGEEERELLDLYPQPRGREASVEYVPAAPLPRRGNGPVRGRSLL
jgi:Serine dehydrogenase proteinase